MTHDEREAMADVYAKMQDADGDALAAYGATIIVHGRVERVERAMATAERKTLELREQLAAIEEAAIRRLRETNNVLIQLQAELWAHSNPFPRLPEAPSVPWWRLVRWIFRGGPRRLRDRQVRVRTRELMREADARREFG